MPLFVQGHLDGQQLPIPDIIIYFGWGEFPGEKDTWMELDGFPLLLGQDSSPTNGGSGIGCTRMGAGVLCFNCWKVTVTSGVYFRTLGFPRSRDFKGLAVIL